MQLRGSGRRRRQELAVRVRDNGLHLSLVFGNRESARLSYLTLLQWRAIVNG